MSDVTESVNQSLAASEAAEASAASEVSDGGGYDRNARTLYRADVRDPDRGTVVFWTTSKAAATREANRYVRDRRKEEKDRGRKECFKVAVVEPVTIPTTRAGLCDWLNRNLYRGTNRPEELDTNPGACP